MQLGNIFNTGNSDLINKFADFKKTMQGKDPEAIVKQLMAEGKMSQSQFENLKKQAQSLMTILR